MYDFRQPRQAPIAQAGSLQQGLEGAVLSLMAELDAGCIEQDRVLRKLRRRFDARFLRGGISAWYAAGGARALRPTAG